LLEISGLHIPRVNEADPEPREVLGIPGASASDREEQIAAIMPSSTLNEMPAERS